MCHFFDMNFNNQKKEKRKNIQKLKEIMNIFNFKFTVKKE